MNRLFARALKLALAGALLSGCSSALLPAAMSSDGPARVSQGGRSNGSQSNTAGAPGDTTAAGGSGTLAGGAESGGEASDGAAAKGAAPPARPDVAVDTGGGIPQQGSGLKGGELDDNASFDRYLAYQESYRGRNVDRVDVSLRHVVQVVDSEGKPVPNAGVSFVAGDATVTARSTSAGRVLFFPRAYPLTAVSTGAFQITATKGALSETATLSASASAALTITLPGARGAVPRRVDLGFVLDVTGSMGDELDRIQQTVGDITARIKSLPGDPEIRLGLVAFRDRGDDFVTRTHLFTSDLATFRGRLNALAASGGGDYPEAVNEAVYEGVSGLDWESGEALRLMFLVGDAPPHMDYAQDRSYAGEMRKAAAAGIKIFPIAASGLDNQGEFVFRQLAQFTGGKFLFITYGGDTPHHVGPIQENDLDDLVVGIVKSELANLD